MKKIKFKILALFLVIALSINVTYACTPVYAESESLSDKYWEFIKSVLVYVGCGYGMAVNFASGNMEGFVENYYLAKNKNGLSFDEWIIKNCSESDDGSMQATEELVKFLQEFIEVYAQEYPNEVEKIDYQLFQTSNYEELFDDYIDIRNAFFETISVPEDLNSMENFRTMLKSQTDYSEFPHLMLGMVFQYQVSSQKTPEGNINQNFSMFQNYEKALTDSAKTPCFIGSWNADGTYRLGVYIFDNQTKSLTIDRTLTSIQQYHYVYNSEDMNACFDLTHSYKGLFSASGNAYINMTDGYWNGWGNLPDATLYPSLREKYMADFSGNVVKLSILGTPDGSIFRLFATEQDAMRYFETCADSGLNFDPNQIYSGGSITINNNGDVTINNNPPDGGNDNPVDSSEMLEKIYNRLGDILTQVKQIKWLSVADVVMDAINSFGGGIGGIVESLVDVISQVFPLCILWDVVRIFEIFEAEPVPPVFDIPIKFVWIDETVTIDLTEYEALFALLRTGEIILFLLGLFNITMSWVGRGDDVV